MIDPENSARTAVVTGSSSGIGAAVAERLARDGWRVVGVDLASAPDRSPIAESLTGDLADESFVAQVIERGRGTQALVHAAGFMRTGELGDLAAADGEAMWKVHVQALVQLANGICPHMARGGRLLAIGSRTSAGAAGKSQYAAAKAAVTALVRSWAIELAPKGVTANVIAPAATATLMLRARDRAGLAPITPPMGRFIEPAEVAAYAAFILSPEAAAVTGQELLICGGASL